MGRARQWRMRERIMNSWIAVSGTQGLDMKLGRINKALAAICHGSIGSFQVLLFVRL